MDSPTRRILIKAAAYVARAILALALIAAGTVKIIHPATFVTDIWSYRLVPESWAYWIAAVLPWLEVVTGAALLTGRQLRGARAIAAGLLLVFLVALVISWVRGLDIACGCFGGDATTGTGTNYPWLVFRDLLLLACLALDRVLERRLNRPAPGYPGSESPAGPRA